EERKQREALCGKLQGVAITLVRSCNDQGILYGALTQQEIATALNALGHGVKARDIRLGSVIKRVDKYYVHVKLDSDLDTSVHLTVNADRKLAVQLPDWDDVVQITHWTRSAIGHHWTCATGTIAPRDKDPADIYHAMLVALRDYVNRNGFPGVVLGLSGGIDSALSAAVAVDALGADRVWCVMMPSPYTSRDSLEDAAECARLLGCRLDTVGIGPAMAAFDTMLAPLFAGKAADTTEENIQSRIRGLSLMALSNKFGPMLLTTGNKSEMSVGYATIYGDMAGGYSVLKDLYKTTVFKLCEWRNRHHLRLSIGPKGPVMPQRVIDKPPTAELRDNQKDADSLPPYDLLDRILIGLVEHERSAAELIAEGIDPAIVARIERLLYIAEYKRRQAPPGVKIGHRNFGRDRRYPISNAFRTA
ncbi:MAG: NAD+ synthase, partial [Polymorphobacter sp.]